MVHEDVLRADRREAVAAKVADALGEARGVRREEQVRPVVDDHLLDVHQADDAGLGIDFLGGRIDRVHHQFTQVGRHVGLQGQLDGGAAPPPLQRGLVGLHEVLGFLLELHIGVADQPEQPRSLHLEAGEQPVHEDPHQLLEHDEADRLSGGHRQAHEALDLAGHRDQRRHLAAIVVARQLQRHHQAHVGDEGKGVRRVHRQRRQHREHALHEIAVEKLRVLAGELCGAVKDDAGLREQRAHMGEGGLLGGDQFARAGIDRVQLLGRGGAVGGAFEHAGAGLADQPGNPDRIELVEIGSADGDEAQPLQQRMMGVLSLGNDPEIEVKPGQLAVDEAGGVVQGDLGNGSGRGLVHGALL